LPPTQFIIHGTTTLPAVPQTTIQNIVVDPTPTATSMLENVELRSYQIIYTRADTGTRVPPPLVEPLSGTVPVNGSLTILNLNVLANNQFLNTPISDLTNFGIDRETWSQFITLNLSATFYGRTLSGREVASAPTGFTMEVFP